MKFTADYLLVAGISANHAVAEMPKNRYLPAATPDFRERLFQLIWHQGLYDGSKLKTTLGLPLKVLDPGRFNKTAGPDFKNASILIDGRKVAGDVEIHKNEKEWFDHGHHISAGYENVVLHVFAERAGNGTGAKTSGGRAIPSIEIGPYLRHPVERLQEELESKADPAPVKAPPCRAAFRRLGKEGTAKILDLAGDGRMLMKSNRVMERIETAGSGQTLYSLMFECMGHSRFSGHFEKIAAKADLSYLMRVMERNPAAPVHLCAQAAYLTFAGSIGDKGADPAFTERLKEVDLDAEPVFGPGEWRLSGCRPANHPQRRMAAFSHLVESGWGRGNPGEAEFRKFVESIPDGEKEAKRFASGLTRFFMRVSDPFWDVHYSLSRPARVPNKLVGKDKAISLVVDCLIPFFLAVCRTASDTAFEHKLVSLYRSLPFPAPSGITDFMTRNVLGGDDSIAKPLWRQQALLQIYRDFCHTAPAGCADCAFAEYLKCV